MRLNMKIPEAIALFLMYLQVRKGRPQSTITTYAGVLKQFSSIIDSKLVSEITVRDIDAYADILYSYNYAPKTLRNKLNAVRSFVRFLYIKGLMDIKPELIDVPPEDKRVEAEFLELEEAQAFISVIDDIRDRALMLFLLATWGRVSEVANVRMEDMHDRSVLIRQGKGNKPRHVFISEETETAINAYIAAKRGTRPGPLFPNPKGEKLSRQWISRRVKRYAEKAGLGKKVSAHTLRHTGATAFLDAGGRLEVAQKILGHSKLETTMVYVHFRDEHLRRDYENVTKGLEYSIS